MLRLKHLVYDVKQIIREPILIILMLIPLLCILLIKPLLALIQPLLLKYVGVDIMLYSIYIVSIVYLLLPGILGTVTGFMMLDDKDGKIYQLMSVTPLGYKGYFFNRVSIPSFMICVYAFIVRRTLDFIYISNGTFIALIGMLLMQGVCISLILFYFADDKVKGLTFSKMINGSMIFALADLVNNRALSIMALGFPQYWFSKTLIDPKLNNIFIAYIIHFGWTVTLLYRFLRSKEI